MDLVELQPEAADLAASSGLLGPEVTGVIDLTEPVGDDDGLSSIRGMVVGIALSVPVWAGLGVVAWRLRH